MPRARIVGVVSALLIAMRAYAAPDIVVISVDTLRADHLGCYGYTHPTSPNIDALARQALVFDDFLCEVPLTAPSLGAMFTGRFPRTIGLTRNGLALRAGTPTLAEVLHAAGYYTLAVQSNWPLKGKLSGLDRGFDVYDDDFHRKRWGVLKSERPGDEVTARALALLAARPRDNPLFAWIHYSDPHAPYRFHRGHAPRGPRRLFIGGDERARRRYDSEIAFTDAQIGKLVDALPADATIVFVGDHGESLGEHGYSGHGRRLYHDNLRVPFFVRVPGRTPARSAAPARGVDLMPTVLVCAGLRVPAGIEGRDLLRGDTPADRVRVVETYRGAVPEHLPALRGRMSHVAPMLQAIVQGPWKLIDGERQMELYDLASDPHELRNLAQEHTDRAAQLRALIDGWEKSYPRIYTDETALEKTDAEALRSLGYLR